MKLIGVENWRKLTSDNLVAVCANCWCYYSCCEKLQHFHSFVYLVFFTQFLFATKVMEVNIGVKRRRAFFLAVIFFTRKDHGKQLCVNCSKKLLGFEKVVVYQPANSQNNCLSLKKVRGQIIYYLVGFMSVLFTWLFRIFSAFN